MMGVWDLVPPISLVRPQGGILSAARASAIEPLPAERSRMVGCPLALPGLELCVSAEIRPCTLSSLEQVRFGCFSTLPALFARFGAIKCDGGGVLLVLTEFALGTTQPFARRVMGENKLSCSIAPSCMALRSSGTVTPRLLARDFSGRHSRQ